MIKPPANHPVLEANMYSTCVSVCICICIDCNLELYPLQRLQTSWAPALSAWPASSSRGGSSKGQKSSTCYAVSNYQIDTLETCIYDGSYTYTLWGILWEYIPSLKCTNCSTNMCHMFLFARVCVRACVRAVCARAEWLCLRLNHNLVGLVNGCLCSFLCCCLCSCWL